LSDTLVGEGMNFREAKLDPKENFYLNEEDAEWVGLKKSEYLSRLIESVGPTDFGFEEYHLFDHLIHGTIQAPDRSMTYDEDGREMRSYLKSYMEKENFHQFVIGVVIFDAEKKSEVFVPVIVFVTRDEELVKKFTIGQSLVRPILN
jgi:hypothetical protein